MSSLLFLDAHTQLTFDLSKDADPNSDGGNLRDNSSLKDSKENVTFITATQRIHYWAHAQNIRGENLQTSGSAVNLTLKDINTDIRATDITDAASDAWTINYSFLPIDPLGEWKLFANISLLNGNTGGDIQEIIIARLIKSFIELFCSQKAPLIGAILCTTNAYDPSTGIISAQLITYNVTNATRDIIAGGSGVASEVSPNTGVYSFTFDFTAPSEGNYVVVANTSGTNEDGSPFETSASTAVYAALSGLGSEQNQTLYMLRNELNDLNSTLMAVENFGSNNLTDLKEKLVDLRTSLSTFWEESKENVFLVTDAVYSVDIMIDKAEEGILDVGEAKTKAKEIREKLVPTAENELVKLGEKFQQETLRNQDFGTGKYIQWAVYLLILAGLLYLAKSIARRRFFRKHHHGLAGNSGY